MMRRSILAYGILAAFVLGAFWWNGEASRYAGRVLAAEDAQGKVKALQKEVSALRNRKEEIEKEMQKAASLSGDAKRQKLQELAKDRAHVDMELEKKEGELRKAEAQATLNTQGATYERPKTLSPGKVAYSKEAKPEDYLAGRVEGQDYPYKKRGPLCKRCHTLRKGKRKLEVHPETTPDGIKLPEQQQLKPEDIGG